MAWEGPLFYPPVGKIAVARSGARIEVWPDESPAGCFTGLLLREGRSYAETVVFDLSCLWARSQIATIEEATAADLGLARATA